MRKLFLLIAALAPTMAFSQAAETTADNMSKISTGLSIGLIIMTGLVAYLMYQREKLLKRNKELSIKINQLQANQ